MMQLNNTYNRDDFLIFLEDNFLTDFKKDIRPASTQGFSSIQKAYSLGRSENLDLQVFEFSFEGSLNKRVTLTKDAFQVMRSSAIFRGLAIFYSPDSDDWRLSLMTATPERTEKGKVSLSYSNPKRLSFFLGPNAKVNTPTKFILKKDRVIDFTDLKSRFSIEVVNKEFYEEISGHFTQLVGGSLYKGKKKEDYKALLKLPFVQDKSQTSLEFAVRLIGRVIFCWFLREKKSDQSKSLMPNDLLSLEAVNKNPDYYHKILEPIFFEVLNKPIKSRKDDYSNEPFSSIPYLNGGLFSPHDDDYYKRTNGDFQSQFHNTLVIPDEWLIKFFEVLETYNFTIDENTSFDEELSIDPEMLGRIFENLLAEINPETGESARKSTGSYYTPRVIVDYMVDESLLLYLKNQTQVEEEKLRAMISYDLNDDEETPLKDGEKEQIINALERIKILDPACGSGAFPIGALQKIVFILQQADPEGQLWFKKQIKNTSPEIKKVIEREFAHKNFDYIRKLGIIRENIYGVDIQPIATEISRLRCFLTLVVDERIQEDLENRGIEPLPNLDFKFVTANTLIGLPGSQGINQMGLFEDDAGIRELKELRDLFFNAFGTDRDQLKLQFVQAQNRMFQRLISEGRSGHADLTTKLTTWDPFSHKSASWFDQEWMFGIKNGFDIVIANPPYIVSKGGRYSKTEFSKEMIQYFKKSYETAEQQFNTYTLFIELAKNLLSNKGICFYIVPNTFLANEYSKKLREFLISKCNIYELYNLGLVFESATVETLVMGFGNILSNTIKVISSPNIYNIINTSEITSLTEDKKLLININDKTLSLIKKLNKLPELKTIAKVWRGLTTGNDSKFICKSKNSSLYKALITGADIEKYGYLVNKKFVKYLPEQLDRARDERIFLLDKKLISKFVGNDLTFTLDENKFYVLNSACITELIDTSINIKYLLALLNSKLINFYFKNLYTDNRDTFPLMKSGNIESLPIKKIDTDKQNKMVERVDKILAITRSDQYLTTPEKQDKVKEYEKQIDQMVYKLYELTPEEIEIVENNGTQ